MPNTIKYSTGTEARALKKGNFWVGVGDVDKGPTGTTGYWNGINPPAGGWTVYLNKASGGPSIYVAANSTELINLTARLSGTTYASAPACINWINDQPNIMIADEEYPMLVTNGLKLAFDADYSISHASDGSDKWYDMIGGGSYLNGAATDPSWMNGVSEITVSCLLEKTGSTVNNYAYHPISKWNSAYNVNSSFILYQFDNYQGNNNDGVLGWYGYTQNFGWTGLTNTFDRIYPGQTVWVSLTYSASAGGHMWVGQQKLNATTVGGGPLGSPWPSTSTVGIYGPMSVGPLKVRHALFYDRVLSDMEMYYNWEAVNDREIY